MAALKTLHEIQISPSLPSQPPQPLSFLDAIWLRGCPLVERIFFYNYPHPVSHFTHHHLPIFTNSLSLTLRHFYLLAGSIRPSSHSADKFEIAYTEGDSIALTIAEFTNNDFRNISSHHRRNFRDLRLLVPKPGKPSSCGQFPPISIQITLFPNQGLSISFAINHAVCDGSASMLFIRSWAAACRSTKPIINDPFLDRSVILDTHSVSQKLFEMRRQFEKYKESWKKDDTLPVLVSATFTLTKEQIFRLKDRVKGETSFHISAFVVTCAYVWRCLVKARGCCEDVKKCFSFTVDWRSRMRPPIPSNYFGNCLGACFVELEVGEIVGKDGIVVASMEIGKSIDALKGKDVGEVIVVVIKRFLENGNNRPLTIAGSPKLRVYETDFGWGRPVKVEITSIVETGAISLAESGEEEGGLEIGLVLSVDEMDKFEKIFTCDLQDV